MRQVHDLAGSPYGATDINAVSGNRGLSVGLNRQGTVTVFKWPNPSYYDQIKYMTGEYGDLNLGVLPNEGAFSGIAYEGADGPGFFWLRDRALGQRYLGDDSVAVLTSFRDDGLGLEIEQIDFVSFGRDLLRRHYRVSKAPGSKVEKARLVSFLNFSPQVSKYAFLPLRDWCLDEVGISSLAFSNQDDLFVQAKQARDWSSGEKSSVAIAFGFDLTSSGHQAGYDRMCSPLRSPLKRDAYYLAPSGLDGSDNARGQVNAALATELHFNAQGEARATLLIGAAGSEQEAAELVSDGRGQEFDRALDENEKYWRDLVSNVPLPSTEDQRIRALCLRGVISLIQGYDRSGAGVASISTQPPYGLDWPRDGVYMNMALMAAGFPELVKERCLFWARAQSRPGHRIPFVPEGNWASNYYADGTPGFPYIWWEIDETGWALWGMLSYYEATGDHAYLEEVYPAVREAADFLVRFRDPKTGLPRKAYEDDAPVKRHTAHGAVPCFLGLKHAALAAKLMGDDGAAQRWQARADELKAAILEVFYDGACGRFVREEKFKGRCGEGGDPGNASLVLWPGELLDPSDPRAEQAAEQVWQYLEESFSGKNDMGMYEPYQLLSLAHFFKDRPDKMERVKQGLEWTSRVPVTDTLHFGENWITIDGRIVAAEAQPHLWHHALFYLAALQAYGSE
jgi:hypothetical protein